MKMKQHEIIKTLADNGINTVGDMFKNSIILNPNEIKIGHNKGFIYPYYKKNTMLRDNKVIDDICDWMHFSVDTMYMTKAATKIVDDKFFDEEVKYSPDEILDLEDFIEERIEDIWNKYPDGGYTARVESNNKSITMLVTARSAGPDHRNDLVIILIYSDEITKCTSSYFIAYKKKQPIMKLSNMLQIGMYYAAKDYVAEQRAKSEADSVLIGILSAEHVKFMKELLSIDGSIYASDSPDYHYPIYKKHEICFYKNSLSRKGPVTNHMILGYKGNIDDKTFHLFDEDSMSPRMVVLEDWASYPKIDFGKSEDRFVNNYCEKMEYLCGKPMNLMNYLKDPMYGKTMKFPCMAKIIDTDDASFEKELKKDLLVTYKLDHERNLAEFWIIEKLTDGQFVSTMINFCNMDRYDLIDSFVNVKTDLLLTRFDRIPMDYGQLRNDSILLNWDKHQTIAAIMYVFKVLVTMHDSPKRTRMVKKTEHKPHTSSGNKNKNNNTEKEYVVSRILMPIKEAKALVQQNSVDAVPGQRREAEYVLEEWPRQGHTRTYKSGKTVYVKETTVHRRLPLTDKEILVKL